MGKAKAMNLQERIQLLAKDLELVVPSDGLESKLILSETRRKPLRVKLGFDPTAPDLHLGHAVVLNKLRDFQQLGHKIVVIIGDFTAKIGDPTGKSKTRPPLSNEEIRINSETYLDQLSKIINVSKAEIYYNSKWLDALKFHELIQIVSKVTLSQILQRDDFNNRQKSDEPIFFHELLYPMIQGYDSVMVNADVEIGGTDQLFNCLVGRDLQGAYDKEKQVVACLPILKGTDGHKKMSKSLNNYIGLTESPENMYGKLMSIPDGLIKEYARLLGIFTSNELEAIYRDLTDESINPIQIKKQLAFNIVRQFHGSQLATEAAKHFYNQVQSRDDTLIEFEQILLKDLNLDISNLSLLALCASLNPEKSKGQIRRMIEGGGVQINSEKILTPGILIKDVAVGDFKLKIGKRGFFQISSKAGG